MRSLLLIGMLCSCASISLWGCGAGWPAVLDPVEVAGLMEGTPHIGRVRDLGNVHLGQAGPLPAQSDGLFTVGELILIEGRGFGKQPTVRVAGRPAEVLWRSAGGGIIARLPTGTASGVQQLTVETSGGKAQTTLPLRRLGLVSDRHRGQVHSLELGMVGPVAQPALRPVGQPLAIKDARQVTMSSDGAAAYVLAGDSQVAVVDLGAPGGPVVSSTRAVRHRVSQVATAERAPVLALLGDKELTLWDVREPARPVPWRPAALPEGTAGYAMGALDPTGALLALGLPDGNRVVVLDIRPEIARAQVRPQVVGQIEVLPGARQQLLVDLRFSSDGETLWVLSGDNLRSVGLGHQPTRLSAVRIDRSAEPAPDQARGQQQLAGDGAPLRCALSVLCTVDFPEVGAPLHLALGRAAPVSGAAIRTPPDKAVVYLTTVPQQSLAPEGAAGERRTPVPLRGALLRIVSPESGSAALVYGDHDDEIYPAVDLGPDGVLALVPSAGLGPQGFGAVLSQAEGGQTHAVALGPGDQRQLRAPFTGASVAVQP